MIIDELIENLNCYQMRNILNDDSKYLIVSVTAFYNHRKKSITIHLANDLPSEPEVHTHCYYAEEIRDTINNMIANGKLKKIDGVIK
jgi:hypothetical protein